MVFVWFRLLNLFLLTAVTATGCIEARSNDIQSMMTRANEAFNKTFAEDFVRKEEPTLAAVASLPAKPAAAEAPLRRPKAEPVSLPRTQPSTPALEFKDCDVCPGLVIVPPGEFVMGSNDRSNEKPAHKVRISSAFAIGQYEITYAEWGQCADAGGCRYRPGRQGTPKGAIGNLSWEDARFYLAWLSKITGQIYRLPSEAEWEYAVRASLHRALDLSAPRPIQLYETSGKMAEWVQDCWHDSYQGAPADGSAWLEGDCSLRSLKGGSFGDSGRFRYDRDVRYEANSFRVLRELR